jgi:hypothetical protein
MIVCSAGAASSTQKTPTALIAGGVVGGIAVLLLVGIALLVCRRRRRRAASGDWGMIDASHSSGGSTGPRSPRHLSLTDAEIQSWRPDRGGKKAPFVRVTSTLVRMADPFRSSIASARRPSAPGTPTTPTSGGSAWAPGRPVTVVPPVPPVPALPTTAPSSNRALAAASATHSRTSDVPSLTESEIDSWRPGLNVTSSVNSRTPSYLDPFRDSRASLTLAPVAEGEEDAKELDKDWKPPASRIRRKAAPSVDEKQDPFADPIAVGLQPPRLELNFDGPSRLSTVSDDENASVPAGTVAGVAM